MQVLEVKGLEFHAYHGCLPEEKRSGGTFRVDVTFAGDFSEAMASDDLYQTIDYEAVGNLVKKEMGIPSKLIEHVAARILNKLKQSFKQAHTIEVTITKCRPPVSVHTAEVAFTVKG